MARGNPRPRVHRRAGTERQGASRASRAGFAPREISSAADAEVGTLDMALEHCPFREAVLAPGGAAVCELGLATNRTWTNQSGEKQEETTFVDITVWGKQAESCNQYLTKGRQVLVEGRIRTGQYEDKSGQTRYTWELVASTVRFLGGRGEAGEGPPPGAPIEDEGEIPF